MQVNYLYKPQRRCGSTSAIKSIIDLLDVIDPSGPILVISPNAWVGNYWKSAYNVKLTKMSTVKSDIRGHRFKYAFVTDADIITHDTYTVNELAYILEEAKIRHMFIELMKRKNNEIYSST